MTEREKIGLPPRIFLYTPDQIATMIEVDLKYFMDRYLWYEGREVGLRPRDKMRAVNIAPEGEPLAWRVQESELLRYLRLKGVKFYDRGFG